MGQKVKFVDIVRVKFIHSKNDISVKEKLDSWYSKDEIRFFQKTLLLTIYEENNENGFDMFLQMKSRYQRIHQVISKVLREQERQRQLGQIDSTNLAKIYYSDAESARLRAIHTGATNSL